MGVALAGMARRAVTPEYTRRRFLSRLWQSAAGLVAAAGVWTTWDVLRARATGARGPVRTVAPDQVPTDGVLELREVSGYLTRVDDEVVALWWRCPHLGCKVPWCETSGQFECPCHGSVFNRVGEYRRGPSPRGMDRYATSIEDGFIAVDTAAITDGAAPAGESIDEPPIGPECLEAEA